MKKSTKPKALWVSTYPDQVKGDARSRRDKELKLYRTEAAAYKRLFSRCVVCVARGKQPGKTVDVHHHRGRKGSLLRDTRYWVPICRSCHNFIHSNIVEARRMGLICDKGDWGKQL